MAPIGLETGMVLVQTVVGMLGNFSLLYHYLFLYFTGCRLKPTDLIVNNLTVANTLVLFSSGIQFTLSSFWWYHHLSDFGCRFFPYVRGVGRGVSIGTTCLLSVYQAITVSPMNSRWAELKVRAPKYIVPLIVFWWVLIMLINVISPLFMYSSLSIKNITNSRSYGLCSSLLHDKMIVFLYMVLLSSPDVLCFVLMPWASGSMIFILYKHKQRVQHIHRTHVSFQSSPESRATKSILLLVSTFVFLNTLSPIFIIILGVFKIPSSLLSHFNILIILCFPTVSPFLIMSHDSRVSRLSFAWLRNIKFFSLRRNM